MSAREIIERIIYNTEVKGDIEVHLGSDDGKISLWDYRTEHEQAYFIEDICNVEDVEDLNELKKAIDLYEWYVVY